MKVRHICINELGHLQFRQRLGHSSNKRWRVSKSTIWNTLYWNLNRNNNSFINRAHLQINLQNVRHLRQVSTVKHSALWVDICIGFISTYHNHLSVSLYLTRHKSFIILNYGYYPINKSSATIAPLRLKEPGPPFTTKHRLIGIGIHIINLWRQTTLGL